MANQLSDITKDKNISEGLSLSEQSSERLHESASQTKTLENRLGSETQKLRSIETTANRLKSEGIAGIYDKTPEVIKAVAKEYGISEVGAINMIEKGDRLTRNIVSRAVTKMLSDHISAGEFSKDTYSSLEQQYYGMKSSTMQKAPQFARKSEKGAEERVEGRTEGSHGISNMNNENASANTENEMINSTRSGIIEGSDGGVNVGTTVSNNISAARAKLNASKSDVSNTYDTRANESAKQIEGGFDKTAVDKEIERRESIPSVTKEALDMIDGADNSLSEKISKNISPNIKNKYSNFKKAIGADRDISVVNESAKQIEKDKKDKK